MNVTPKGIVLVVDDEPAMRALERRILDAGGYEVVEAAGAAAAFETMAAGLRPDLVIADLDMPEIPGEEMVRAIHRVRPNQRVLYVTANIDRLLDVQSIVWEGEAFLSKPFTSKGLLEAVSLLLNGTIGTVPLPAPSVASPSGLFTALRRALQW